MRASGELMYQVEAILASIHVRVFFPVPEKNERDPIRFPRSTPVYSVVIVDHEGSAPKRSKRSIGEYKINFLKNTHHFCKHHIAKSIV